MAWLKNLDIRRISFVRKDKSKPVHPKAQLLFVKSEEKKVEKEESKKMSLLDFLRKKKDEFGEVLKEEETNEIKKADKTTAEEEVKKEEVVVDYVSKSEFSERMSALESSIAKLSEVVEKSVSDNINAKEEVSKSLSEFTKDFLTAYEADQLKLQKAVVEQKREEAHKNVLPEQKDITGVIKKSTHPDSLFFLDPSNQMNTIIEKGLKDGTLKGVNVPEGQKSYDKAFTNLFGGK